MFWDIGTFGRMIHYRGQKEVASLSEQAWLPPSLSPRPKWGWEQHGLSVQFFLPQPEFCLTLKAT